MKSPFLLCSTTVCLVGPTSTSYSLVAEQHYPSSSRPLRTFLTLPQVFPSRVPVPLWQSISVRPTVPPMRLTSHTILQ